jgi:hypothetical protein
VFFYGWKNLQLEESGSERTVLFLSGTGNIVCVDDDPSAIAASCCFGTPQEARRAASSDDLGDIEKLRTVFYITGGRCCNFNEK